MTDLSISKEGAVMDAELKDKWLAALRSGEYAQGRGTLRRDDTYCCLGVLCDVSGKGGWEVSPAGQWEYVIRDANGSVTKCAEVDLLGLLNEFGLPGLIHTESTEKNDRGETFASIADYLEGARS